MITRRNAIRLMGTAGLLSFAGSAGSWHVKDENMLQRKIPSSGENLPVIGLGSWLQFDVDNDASERKELTDVLRLMAEKGGRLIDSSPMYGKAEEVIGELTQASGLAERFFYATKVWTTGRQQGIEQMESSMRKMKRKTIDLMQVHNLQDWKTQLETMRRWKAEGRIRYTGITHYTTAAHSRLQELVEAKAIDFVQCNYSIRVRNAETSLLKAAMDNGVAVIINEPFESGSLFGRVKGKPLPDWAKEYDINSWAQFFLKYIISHPAVNCVIPGTSNPGHLVDNMGAGYGRLPDDAARKKMAAYIEHIG
ncbi:MAG: aldo/keto reductase [Chitinophagaceae bacterium]|nr:aldo/keto reductase [Chitinophagaceae bacterium]